MTIVLKHTVAAGYRWIVKSTINGTANYLLSDGTFAQIPYALDGISKSLEDPQIKTNQRVAIFPSQEQAVRSGYRAAARFHKINPATRFAISVVKMHDRTIHELSLFEEMYPFVNEKTIKVMA